MFKKAKVVMLSTNQKSRLFKGGGSLNYLSHPVDDGEGWRSPQHLYILSDDEIKVGDWFIWLDDENQTIQQAITMNQYIGKNEIPIDLIGKTGRKIIATTDKSLDPCCDDGLPKVCKCNLGLPQPSPQFIEKYIEEYNNGNVITDVMVEYIYMGKDAIENGSDIEVLKINPKDNTITIKKVKDSWSREEHISDIKRLIQLYETTYIDGNIDKWIEENL